MNRYPMLRRRLLNNGKVVFHLITEFAQHRMSQTTVFSQRRSSFAVLELGSTVHDSHGAISCREFANV